MDLQLLQTISEYSDLKTVLRIVVLSKWSSVNIKVKYVNDHLLHYKINDAILCQKRYFNLIELNAYNNPNITKISHHNNATKLEKLNIGGRYCKVNNNELEELFHLLKDSDASTSTLIELNASDNPNITKISYLKKLQKLNISYGCGINDNELKDLGASLIELDVSFNPKITKINHHCVATRLQKLSISGGNCKITNDELFELFHSMKDSNLIELNVSYNPNITKISHPNIVTRLQKLDISGHTSKINDDAIKDLNLIELCAAYNSNITKISHMTKLQKLNISGDDSKITNDELKELFDSMKDSGTSTSNLIELNVSDNPNITKISYFKKLQKLYIGYRSRINDDELEELIHFKKDLGNSTSNFIELNASYNKNITKHSAIFICKNCHHLIY